MNVPIASQVANSAQIPWTSPYLSILVFQKIHLLLKLTFRETDLRQRPKLFIFEKAPTDTLVASLNVVLKVVSIHEEFLFVFGVSRHFQGI